MVFSYLSVLISIILGLGIAHVLGAFIRLLRHRSRFTMYWPSVVWAFNLLGLMVLVWWSDFSLTSHDNWNFAIFVLTLTIPALLYVVSGLILPSGESLGQDALRQSYEENRVWFFSLLVAAVASSFIQSLLLDGHITANLDSALKLLVMVVMGMPIVLKGAWVQKAVAVFNSLWLALYIGVLFSNLHRG